MSKVICPWKDICKRSEEYPHSKPHTPIQTTGIGEWCTTSFIERFHDGSEGSIELCEGSNIKCVPLETFESFRDSVIGKLDQFIGINNNKKFSVEGLRIFEFLDLLVRFVYQAGILKGDFAEKLLFECIDIENLSANHRKWFKNTFDIEL